MSSPEDTILAKLRWSKLGGGTSKPYIDAPRVYEVQNEVLSHPYIDVWAGRLGVTDLGDRLQREAEPTQGLPKRSGRARIRATVVPPR